MSACERADPGTTGGPFNGTWSGPDEPEPDGVDDGSTL
jgi:hypothetical protein